MRGESPSYWIFLLIFIAVPKKKIKIKQQNNKNVRDLKNKKKAA